METSVVFTISAKDDFSYHAVKAAYAVLHPTKMIMISPHIEYKDAEREIYVEYYSAGGVHQPVEDTRAIKYILAKYGISDAAFSISGVEDSDYGNYILFDIRYAEGAATIAQSRFCIYPDSEPEDCEDVTFVVTGKLKHFENREEIVEYIEDLGGRVTGSISKKTNYLINNDPQSASSKNVKAQSLGIPVITEEEFIRKFGDPDEFDMENDHSDYAQQAEAEAEEELKTAPRVDVDNDYCIFWQIRPLDKTALDAQDKSFRLSFAAVGIDV